ncbi:uncharacterized protein [Palaemon carinicauda]|uniref:uncharacterized protein isoform X2 n=1 Tax=Palaemon carinicauda TaxID=392227 RepID=UPI0035B5C3BD
MLLKIGLFNCFLLMCILATLAALALMKHANHLFLKKRIIYEACGDECIKVDNSSHYLIQTEGCNIPDFASSHPDIARFTYKNVKELVCSKRPPLTEESGLTLIFYEERIPLYGSSAESLNCFYQGILRVTQSLDDYDAKMDSKNVLMAKRPILKRVTEINYDGIVVTCNDSRLSSGKLYRNIHFFIQPSRAKEKREKFKISVTELETSSERLSIIIMGTDSVSRGSFVRHMPLTFNYLTNNLQSIDLQGMNKVGDNTYPNVAALLMGLTVDEIKNHSCQDENNPYARLDICPLIWRDFSKKGYVTAYGEDSPNVGSFHHNLPGFVEEPTDYYNRPFFITSDRLTGHRGGMKAIASLCQGGRFSNVIIHNYSLAIAKELEDIPYFGYFWTTAITHDSLQGAVRADRPNLEYLQKLHNGGYLNRTVLFFISDHGMRSGEFRMTYSGMLEERLPFAHLVFPRWFRDKYPKAVKNLITNAKRLTSTFDLYATLHDILYQNYEHLEKRGTAFKHGQSLFQEIPENRTCESAGVPEHYCACEHTKAVDPDDPHLIAAADEAVTQINLGLSVFPKCAVLKLIKVLSGRVGSARAGTTPELSETLVTTYMVTFITEPESPLRCQGLLRCLY